MSPFAVHAIRPDLDIRIVRAMPPLSRALEARIDGLWDNAARRVAAGGAGRLFNGRIFSIDTIAPDRITGHLTEYRRHIAQIEDPGLFPALGIRSLAACGVLRCGVGGPDEGIVIGRRPAGAVYQPGMWQLCPAGSVDAGAAQADGTMDVRAQLRAEAREELGLDPAAIGPITPLCIVEHPGSHVCDLGMTAVIALDGAAVREAHRSRGDGEYDPLRIIRVPALPAFITWAGNSLVAPAPIFLARARLLDQGDSPPTGP